MNAEQFLSENYNGFFDEFDITELQDIIQAMEDYKDQALIINGVSKSLTTEEQELEEIIKPLRGRCIGKPLKGEW